MIFLRVVFSTLIEQEKKYGSFIMIALIRNMAFDDERTRGNSEALKVQAEQDWHNLNQD